MKRSLMCRNYDLIALTPRSSFLFASVRRSSIYELRLAPFIARRKYVKRSRSSAVRWSVERLGCKPWIPFTLLEPASIEDLTVLRVYTSLRELS